MFSPTPMKGRGVFLVVLDVIFKLVDFFLRYLFECTGKLVPILKIEKQIILFVLKFLRVSLFSPRRYVFYHNAKVIYFC